MKAILKDGRLKYQTQCKVIFDIDGNQTVTKGATDAQWLEWGFKEVVVPTITENQILGDWYETDITITKDVIDKTVEEIDAELAQKKLNLIRYFETDTDFFIKDVIGERGNEYAIAEEEAIAFKTAGYPELNVPHSVSSDAIANGRTNIEACDLILLMSTNWRTAQAALRANRLLAKAQTTQATTLSGLKVIEDTWDNFMSALRGQIIE